MQRGENVEKRIVVAGCRDYTDYNEAKVFIEDCLKQFRSNDIFILISGTCRGADQLGEQFAKENGWVVECYPADWKKYGRAAGPIRNKQMIDICDFAICFWDGKSRGAGSLIQYAQHINKPIAIKRIDIHA